MTPVPFVHDDRCAPQAVQFTDSHVIIDMADGRGLCLPLHFFPWLESASDSQRQNYQLNYYTIDWEELDEGIDMVAMLTGLYIGELPRMVEALKPALEAALA